MHPYRLAKAGGDVLLVESSDLNTGASGRNAGGFHVRIQFDAFATMSEAWAHEWVATIPLLIDAIGRWQALEAAPALAHAARATTRAPFSGRTCWRSDRPRADTLTVKQAASRLDRDRRWLAGGRGHVPPAPRQREIAPAEFAARTTRHPGARAGPAAPNADGACNRTPDHRPIIGELAGAPCFFMAVFPFLGFTAGPLMGNLVADIARGEPAGYDPAPFSPGRF